ncbi:MAG: type 4a pilus biogenesis protein PilO [Elusimicrobiales bacterium]|jgi:Tfp pilus assembly protein PilO|nr:type 4a pilus biogenesis protein PilO [Elusimicrobiales bacterium]NLH39405.1 type 4a pilus biogenesis protein PilO [Elusimicrobiota bacterium]
MNQKKIKEFFDNLSDKLFKEVKNLISDIQSVYIEKGMKPFQKPLMYSIGAIMISYLIYASNKSTLNSDITELSKLKNLSGFYNEYVTLKKETNNYIDSFPPITEKDEWLNTLLNSTAAKYKIVFTNIESQEEIKLADQNIYLVSKRVHFITDYHTLGLFLSDIENHNIFVDISGLTVTKISGEFGKLNVSLVVSTVFAERVV